jgi:hypothetical protein
LSVNLQNGVFKNNSADLALLYVSRGCILSIAGTYFLENYSTGRGSIVFSENKNSFAYLKDSSFMSNQAILGGVFFS